MNRIPQFVVTSCISFGSALAQVDPVILGSENIAGTADVLLLGQSFTISKPVKISSIQVYAKRIGGGSSFQIYLQPFDPWTGTRGTALASKNIPLSSIPSDPQGGWVSASFEPPISIASPGVYAIFVDSDSEGAPDGYNDFGYALGDSIRGGRLIGPIFGSEVEMLFRIRGAAETDAFNPGDFIVPKIVGPTLENRYSASAGRNLIYAKISWETELGAAYIVWTSKVMKLWFANPRLGNGGSISFERSNEYWDSTFFRIQVMPLGDYKK